MDFSFVQSDAGLKRKSSETNVSSQALAPSSGTVSAPRVAVPSFAEVQRSELRLPAHPANATITSEHQPSTKHLSSSHSIRTGSNPFAFIDDTPGIKPLPAGQNTQLVPLRQQESSQNRLPPAHLQQPPAHIAPPGPSAQRPWNNPPNAGLASHPPAQLHQNNAAASRHFQPNQPANPSQLRSQPHQHRGSQADLLPANAIIVNRRQDGNPVLKFIRNVRWQFGDIVPDYMIGKDAAALFISLRYHLLKPDYIHQRIRELQRSFRLRLILCHVDTEDAVEPLAQVTRAAIGNDCTLVCAWSNQECARYLETFKSYENKPAEVIQKDLGSDYISRINATLTTIRGVNKTDVKTLGDRYGSVSSIFKAGMEELQQCPGIGPTKAKRLFDTFHEPFRKSVATGAAGQGPAALGGPAQQASVAGSSGGASQRQQQQQQAERARSAPLAIASQPQQLNGGVETPPEVAADLPGPVPRLDHPGGDELAQGTSRGGALEEFECDVDEEEDWDV